MSSLVEQFVEIVQSIERPGDFYMSGTAEIPLPGLEIDGVGPVALPLLPAQARQLMDVAEQAPYGKGDQTLVDLAVRRTRQIDAADIRLTSKLWPKTLERIVERAKDGLGVTGPVDAELYKLLIYDTGSFFVSHRDSEKRPRMFGTLVIVLPGAYSGGELIVRHQGQEARLDLRCDDPSEVGFAAFYADCLHEIAPLLSGCRVALVYNLLRSGKGAAPKPPSYLREKDRLAALFAAWGDRTIETDEPLPDKLVYLTDHAYTAESLSFSGLKGADAAKAATLIAAAAASDCAVQLALISIEEYGSATYLGRYGRHHRDSHEDFQIDEVVDRTQTLSGWHRPDGPVATLGALPIEPEEVAPPEALDELAPDEESFQEATGNEGGSFERSYRAAAFVLWPHTRRLAVLNQGGLETSLPTLTDLAERWAKSGADRTSPLWLEAHELASHMLRSPWRSDSTTPDGKPSQAAAMLDALYRLGDSERIGGFLSEITAAGKLGLHMTKSAARALRLLEPVKATDLVQQIVLGNAEHADASAKLLADSAAMPNRVDLKPAAHALLTVLPGDPAIKLPGSQPWTPPRKATADLVADALVAFDRIEPAKTAILFDLIEAWPRTYDPDTVLVPAGLKLARTRVKPTEAVQRLRSLCMTHLRTRIAETLQPPADWVRHADLTCSCAYCRDLAKFLADPTQKSWMFKAAEPSRRHIQAVIREQDIDIDTTTIRKGSPHILACTKNQASYERRVRQRQQDLKNLERFEGWLTEPPQAADQSSDSASTCG